MLFWWAKSWCVCLLPGHEAHNGHGEAPIHSDTLKLHSIGMTTRKADAFHLCLYWIAWLLQIPVLNLRKGVHPLQTKNVFLLIAKLYVCQLFEFKNMMWSDLAPHPLRILNNDPDAGHLSWKDLKDFSLESRESTRQQPRENLPPQPVESVKNPRASSSSSCSTSWVKQTQGFNRHNIPQGSACIYHNI